MPFSEVTVTFVGPSMSSHRFALENEILAASRMDATVNISSGSSRGNNGNSAVVSNKENDNGGGAGGNSRGNKSSVGNRSNSSMTGSKFTADSNCTNRDKVENGMKRYNFRCSQFPTNLLMGVEELMAFAVLEFSASL